MGKRTKKKIERTERSHRIPWQNEMNFERTHPSKCRIKYKKKKATENICDGHSNYRQEEHANIRKMSRIDRMQGIGHDK